MPACDGPVRAWGEGWRLNSEIRAEESFEVDGRLVGAVQRKLFLMGRRGGGGGAYERRAWNRRDNSGTDVCVERGNGALMIGKANVATTG